MRIWTNGEKDYGEWHLNKPTGCQKVEHANCDTHWGELMEGYGTIEAANGDRYIG
jgi:hypothetical protein